MKVIRFRDRVAIPKKFKAGVELDNVAEQIKFELPQFADGQHENFIWENDDYSNIEELEDGVLTVTNAMSQYPGLATCYITINVGETLMWHSELFYMDIISLPDTEERIVQEFPGALMTAVLRAEDAQDAAEDAQTAAETAQTAAEAAQGAAEAAQAAAEAAVTGAEAAQGMAEAAQSRTETLESSAAAHAQLAGNRSTAAAASATAAAESATDAAGSATDAAASATTAAGKANDAAASAAAAAVTAAQIVTDEATRQANETARTLAEASRAAAEEDREDAETARETAETTRTNAESARMMAEASRQSTEGTRANNETARQTAETARVSAEVAREAAEAARESSSAAAVQEAEDAADAANAAAEAVSGEVAAVNGAVVNYPIGVNQAVGVMPLTFTHGAYPVPAVGSTADISAPVINSNTSAFMCAKARFVAGQTITFKTGGGSSSYRVIGYYDSDFNVIRRGATSAYEGSVKLDPAEYPNLAWVVVNTRYIDDYYAYIGDSVQSQIAKKQDTKTEYQGCRLSLLGDSFSAIEGYSTGGHNYYPSSASNVESVDQMWWKIVADHFGMTPLVIGAWSGSPVAAGVRSGYTPASDTARCEALDDGTNNPDVVLIAMGVNDYSYSSAESQFGTWDGTTALGSETDLSDYDNTSFKTAYATMLARIQKKYPNAYIVCITPWFQKRRETDTGVNYLNKIGKSISDYADAVREICNIMHVACIDGTNIGFNRRNYYPTYCQDAITASTHPNVAGHAQIAKAIIAQMERLHRLGA